MSEQAHPRQPRSPARTACRRALVLAALLASPTAARAETTVPLDLQVDLLWKVVRFERGLLDRAGPKVTLMLVLRPGNATSSRSGAQLEKALERVKEIGGKPVRIVLHPYTSIPALKAAVAAEGAQLVYLTPGFDTDVPVMAGALAGVPVITIATDGDQVERGVILGFELVSAKPRISLNVGQAKRQGLDFNSDLFRLVKVVK